MNRNMQNGNNQGTEDNSYALGTIYAQKIIKPSSLINDRGILETAVAMGSNQGVALQKPAGGYVDPYAATRASNPISMGSSIGAAKELTGVLDSMSKAQLVQLRRAVCPPCKQGRRRKKKRGFGSFFG